MCFNKLFLKLLYEGKIANLVNKKYYYRLQLLHKHVYVTKLQDGEKYNIFS